MVVAAARELSGWLVDLSMPLPLQLRPAVTGAVLVLIVCFLLSRRRMAQAWHRLLRIGSRSVHGVVGLLLFPEYRITSGRRAAGQPPPGWTRTTTRLADPVLDKTAALYARHLRPPQPKRRWPIPLAVIVLALLAVPGYLEPHLPASSGAANAIDHAYDHWISYEYWAQGKTRPAAPRKPVPFRATARLNANATLSMNLGPAHASRPITILIGVQKPGAKAQPTLVGARLNAHGQATVKPPVRLRSYFARGKLLSCIDGHSITVVRVR
jgi:hypothetical protein